MKRFLIALAGICLLAGPAWAKDLKLEGIVVEEGEGKAKTIHVPVVLMSDKDVATKDVKVLVYVYEVKDDKLMLSSAPVNAEWNPPVDWKDSDTEDVTLNYPGPTEAGREYIGFIVGLYYKGKLEDSWASAPELLKEFPLEQESKPKGK